jgi:hypothetical protein
MAFRHPQLRRLARSVRELLDLIALCDANGVPVETSDRQVDTGTATGRMVTTILAAVDQMNAEVAAEHSAAGVAIARANGAVIGRHPYGSHPGEDPAAVVAAFTEAGSLNGAARLLNARGVPTKMPGGRWSSRTIKNIVNREADGTIPPGMRRGARAVAPHELSGLLLCPSKGCGRILTSKPRTFGRQWYCPAAHVESSHARPYAISEARIMPAIRDEAAHYRAPGTEYAADRSAQAAKLTDDLARIKRLAKNGVLDEDEAASEASAIRAQLATLDQEAGPVAIPQAISWTAPAPELNAWLRAVWPGGVKLGPDLVPVAFGWARGYRDTD